MVERAKRRPRTHIIADLGVNHVERFALHAGFVVERVPGQADYGIDMRVRTFDANGKQEADSIKVQVKATDHFAAHRLKTREAISFQVSSADVAMWGFEMLPVIFVVYDAQEDAAYWQYVQRHLEEREVFDVQSIEPESWQLHIPLANRIDVEAMYRFAAFKEELRRQVDGRLRHGGFRDVDDG